MKERGIFYGRKNPVFQDFINFVAMLPTLAACLPACQVAVPGNVEKKKHQVQSILAVVGVREYYSVLVGAPRHSSVCTRSGAHSG